MRSARRRRHLQAAAGLLTVTVLFTACDDGTAPPDGGAGQEDAGEAVDGPTDGATVDGEEVDGGEGDGEAEAGTDPALPDVALLDPDEVARDAPEDTLDGVIASSAADLPDGWQLAVVADPTLGPYVLGLPPGATIWRVGDPVDPLGDAATDAAWWRYWEPVLTEANEAVDGSSLRAAVVLPGAADGQELHLTLTATPQQDLPVEDPEAVATFFAESFREQGLEIVEVTTERAGDEEVGAVTVTTPDDEFDDGVPRRLRQWFYPEADAPVVWSLTCEGTVPAVTTVDRVCPTVLAAFRTPPR